MVAQKRFDLGFLYAVPGRLVLFLNRWFPARTCWGMVPNRSHFENK